MVAHSWESIPFQYYAVLMLSSLCCYTCTVYMLPPFTPTKKMLEMHKDKGDEDWEIYAECLREAMAKQSGFKICNQPLREKI